MRVTMEPEAYQGVESRSTGELRAPVRCVGSLASFFGSVVCLSVAFVPSGAYAGESTPAPTVLGSPREALAHASEPADADERLRAAEIALIIGDFGRALAMLRSFEPRTQDEDSRRVRLELDAALASGDRRLAEERLVVLAQREGWSAHVRRQDAHLQLLSGKRQLARFGTLLFAMSLSVLLWCAGRELLRLRRETLVFGFASVVALFVFRAVAASLVPPLGVAALATLSMVHASAAARSRLAPGARGRLVLALFLVLGMLGASLAVSSQLDPSRLFATVAT